MKKKLIRKKEVVEAQEKINDFPKRVFIPESGWCPILNKSISAGYCVVNNEKEFEGVKHLTGIDKSIFRGEKI